MKQDARQVTIQGVQKITVYFKDKLNADSIWTKEITRAFLAKMYHEKRVVGAIKHVPVIEV